MVIYSTRRVTFFLVVVLVVVVTTLVSVGVSSFSIGSFPSSTITTTVIVANRRRSRTTWRTRTFATVADDETQPQSQQSSSSSSNNSKDNDYDSPLKQQVLSKMAALRDEANEYAASYDLSSTEAAVYALFSALRQARVPLGLKGQPLLFRRDEITQAFNNHHQDADDYWANFFTIDDLEKAVTDDFLDAARGSTDNRKGWKITDVSVPRGDSFEEARMTFQDVQKALDKGTVIFNAAGAHICKLAGPSLACSQGSLLPAALNLYVTAAHKRTSAPPHTDKQDVVVIQSTGRKYWKVYAPPHAARKPLADVYARGKMDDDLPLYQLEQQSDLLIETILHPGDVLFVPAAFPHTTGTVIIDKDNNSNDDDQTTSVHLTYGMDHHIWDLDYLSARRLALRRACVTDTALGDQVDDALRYVGACNELPTDLHRELFAALPLGLLVAKDDPSYDDQVVPALMQEATEKLKDVSRQVDEHFGTKTCELVDDAVWGDTMQRLVKQGVELLDTHVDMYLAAMEEGRTREAEDAMTAHLTDKASSKPVMTQERVQRLSLFRVKRYYDEINNSKNALQEWSMSGKPASSAATASNSDGSGSAAAPATLPANWAFTMPVKVGDEVEADLGGAFFAAKVSRVGPGGDTYDVQFFDGDRESGLERDQIKLLKPPVMQNDDNVDTSKMTPKQLKRWKKQQAKKKK